MAATSGSHNKGEEADVMQVKTEERAKESRGKYLSRLKLSELVKRTRRHPDKHLASPDAEDAHSNLPGE